MKWEYCNYKSGKDYEDVLGESGWEMVAVDDGIMYFIRPLPEKVEPVAEVVHGVNCPKYAHEINGAFTHSTDYDGIVDIGSTPYCGRCHEWLENSAKVTPSQSEADRLKSELATVKKELESACRRHAAELERAAQYKGISMQYREIVCTVFEAIKLLERNYEDWSGFMPVIAGGDLQELFKIYRTAKAGICAEVDNGK